LVPSVDAVYVPYSTAVGYSSVVPPDVPHPTGVAYSTAVGLQIETVLIAPWPIAAVAGVPAGIAAFIRC
jgi:hypothetical protein